MKVVSQRELFRALWLLFGRSKELESTVEQAYDALKLLLPPNEFISFFSFTKLLNYEITRQETPSFP